MYTTARHWLYKWHPRQLWSLFSFIFAFLIPHKYQHLKSKQVSTLFTYQNISNATQIYPTACRGLTIKSSIYHVMKSSQVWNTQLIPTRKRNRWYTMISSVSNASPTHTNKHAQNKVIKTRTHKQWTLNLSTIHITSQYLAHTKTDLHLYLICLFGHITK